MVHIYMLTVFACIAMTLASETNAKCDNKIIQCIKDVNGGSFPVSFLTSLQVLWNSQYSIVWYSRGLVQEQNLTCITTKFSLLGSKDTYHNGCTSTELIDFKTSFNIWDHTFTISEYQGMTLKAYAIYHKKYCLGLYVCSPDGVTGSHITIYCPTSQLARANSEIEEAKAKFTACHINDGTPLCDQKCN
ncbi:uncharacterized protein LOC124358651 [Homalodisca vitripennis]|uniref:uncharacterized protein LOC124358651 n=1 Tax=Homalodisca vitripennis TaxID=197043 RepID=UPI001EEAC93C|nr:uncharacterized protein LOC124358651 [Homalodisca vitripennis]